MHLRPTGLPVLLLLAGCTAPTTFQASIDIQENGSYTVRFQGNTTDPVALARLQQPGGPASGANGIVHADYTGNGRYLLAIRQTHGKAEALHLLEMLHLEPARDGSCTVRLTPPPDALADRLTRLGVGTHGTLSIRLPRSARVLAQNADETPGLFSLSDAYRWQSVEPGRRPFIRWKPA